jgi:hypothetical protein
MPNGKKKATTTESTPSPSHFTLAIPVASETNMVPDAIPM